MPPLSLRFVPLLALAVFGSSCKPSAPSTAAATAPLVNIRVAAVTSSTATPAVRAAGVLALQTEADLAFPVAGMIESVSVRAGDHVKRDQPLARLQPDQTDAQFSQATSALEKARRDLARIEKLQAERVATLENLQDARTQVDQASAALRVADFNRRHSVIAAPADGIVLRRLAEPNELVAAGRPVLSFASEGDGWIAKAGLATRDAARLVVGASVTVDDGAGGAAVGKIARLAEATDGASRTVPIEVQLDSPPPRARSGLIVTLLITPPPVAARTTVPLAALRDGTGGQASVFLVAPGARTAKRVTVEIEQIDGDRVYLRTALPSDASVVVTGGQYLYDGAIVNVTP